MDGNNSVGLNNEPRVHEKKGGTLEEAENRTMKRDKILGLISEYLCFIFVL